MPVQTFGMGIGRNSNLSRQSRRLYIDSITFDVDVQNLADFFNSKMIEMCIRTIGQANLFMQCSATMSLKIMPLSRSWWSLQTNLVVLTAHLGLSSSEVLKTQLQPWPSTASFSLTVHWKSADRRIMEVPRWFRPVFTFLVSFPPMFATRSTKSSSEIYQLISKKSRYKGYSRTSANSKPSTLFGRTEAVLQRCNPVVKGLWLNLTISQRYAYFEYADTSVTDSDVTIQSLNGMEIGDKYLVVQRGQTRHSQLALRSVSRDTSPYHASWRKQHYGCGYPTDAQHGHPRRSRWRPGVRGHLRRCQRRKLSIRCCRGPSYPSAHQERQDEICVWRHGLPVRSRRTARRRSCRCQAGVRQVRKCAGCTGRAQGARRTVVCRAVYHRDGAERGQSDDASAQIWSLPHSLMCRHLFPLLELNVLILFLLSCWCPVGGDMRIKST